MEKWVIFLFVLKVLLVKGVERIDLGGKWEVSNANLSIRTFGTVPGVIHTDLLDAGIITDPYYRFNDLELQWIPNDTWNYTRAFNISSQFKSYSSIVLVCEGLDTVTNISINSKLVAQTNNMFLQYVFDIKPYINIGVNTLSIVFASPIAYSRNQHSSYVMPTPLGMPPECPPDVQNGFCYFNFIRKSPCSFSWDWGPAFAPIGIWKPIRIEGYNDAVIRYVTVKTIPTSVSIPHRHRNEDEKSYFPLRDNSNDWEIHFTVHLDSSIDQLYGNLKFNVSNMIVSLPVTLSNGLNTVPFVTTFSSPALWWPNGYGNPSLYPLQVSFIPYSGSVSSLWNGRIGFRTVELMRETIASNVTGKTMYFKINGIPVFMKGSNWVPADAFESRVSYDLLFNLINSARDANMNVLRNWGGGIYQHDMFYSIADELGIMIWEEFIFACALYPIDSAFLENVRREILHQVLRISHHPSVVVFGGNNENEVAIAQSWWNTQKYTDIYSKEYSMLYFDTIYSNITALDPSLIYIPSSPSNGYENETNPIAGDPQNQYFGDVHYYNYFDDCWDPKIFPLPRFASEYGYQSFPSFLTMKNVSDSTQGDWSWNSKFTLHRQHHEDGNDQILLQMQRHFKIPVGNSTQTYSDLLHMSQIVGGLCIKFESEHYRRSKSELDPIGRGKTMGTIYWQHNDIWQGASWSGIEWGGRWKVLHYYAVRFFAPVLVSPFVRDNVFSVYLVSDLVDDMDGTLILTMWSWDSFVPLSSWNIPVTMKALTAGSVYQTSFSQLLNLGKCSDASHCVLTVHVDGKTHDASASHSSSSSSSVVSADNVYFISDFVDVTKLKNPNLRIVNVLPVSNDLNEFVIEIEADLPAAFTWLETPFRGRFEDNSFLLTQSAFSIRFFCWELNPITPAQVQLSLSIRSLYDVYF